LPGREAVRAFSNAMDACLADLWTDAATSVEGLALVAVGGYGRGELAPRSDVDLVILHRSSRHAPDVTRRLLYPLWDAGVEVGHATRTVKECLKLAKENLEAETAFLDIRHIAGDAEMSAELTGAAGAQALKRRDKILEALAVSTAARHQASGDAPFLLEPNIKESAGGLRDMHVYGWLTLLFGDTVAAEDFGAEADLLHAVRCWLHDTTSRRTDTFVLAYQDAAAGDLGYAGDRAGDALMRDMYAAMRRIWWSAQTALVEARPAKGKRRGVGDGVVVEGERVVVDGPLDAAVAMRAFVAAAREGLPLAAATAAALKGVGGFEWTPEMRRAFLDVLRTGNARTLEQMDHTGVLPRLIPEWEAVRSLPQRNIYHRWTVDVHGFETVREMASLQNPRDEDRLAGDVWNDLRDTDRALLAGLLHDAGKGSGEDHAIVGERIALAVARRIGFGEGAAEIAWLVRHHLLLAETATRREADQRIVENIAAQIGSIERARALYVLTVADSRATGPEAWTPWKSALVTELFTKALNVLERGDVTGADADAIVKLRTAELRDALASPSPSSLTTASGPIERGTVDAHLLGMTRSYVLSFPTTALVRHFSLMAAPPVADEVRLVATQTGERGVWEVTIVALDRPGLFSTMSGVLALNGVNILGAQAYTRADDTALEVFRVAGALDPSFPPERWERIRADAAAVLAGRLDLEAEVAKKGRAYAKASKGKREPARVVVDNQASDFATVVEVHTTDRVGLLYEITRALASTGCDIEVARIATYGDDVVDVFYVNDLVGARITDPARIAEIERAILSRIGSDR
jgi:[protein-PII] uridylyltransferase